MAGIQKAKLIDLRRQIFSLDEEELWMFVCLFFPDAAEETLEDIFDALLSASRREGSHIPADQVFAEEDHRREVYR